MAGGHDASAAISRIQRAGQKPRFAVCVRNDGYEVSLERHKLYAVLPDTEAAQDGDIRIVDESGEDYLYPADWFEPIEVSDRVEESLLHAR